MSEFTLFAKFIVILCWMSAFGASAFVYRNAHDERGQLAVIAFFTAPIAVLFTALMLHLVWQLVYGSYYVLTN